MLRGLNLFEFGTSTRLRPLNVLELPESQSAERPQSFCDFEAKTLGSPKRLKRLNLLEVLGDCTPNQKD